MLKGRRFDQEQGYGGVGCSERINAHTLQSISPPQSLIGETTPFALSGRPQMEELALQDCAALYIYVWSHRKPVKSSLGRSAINS